MVVPAAPALVTISKDIKYYNALIDADFAIPDSGFMLLILRLFKGINIKKLSGYAFLKHFLNEKDLYKDKCLFLIDPSDKDSRINNNYLKCKSILIDINNHYSAPLYDRNNIEDMKLLEIIEKKKPKYIIINLGGGIQERLGLYLKNHLTYRPAIICTGAAIAFLTGQQVKIAPWVDKLYLGWLWRCISKPTVYIPRYIKGFKLIIYLIKEPILEKKK